MPLSKSKIKLKNRRVFEIPMETEFYYQINDGELKNN